MRSTLTAAVFSTLMLSPAIAGETTVMKTDATFQIGALNVSNGNSDRVYGSTHVNYVNPDGLGIHTEVAAHLREQDAAFFVGGVSYALTPMLRPKVTIGTSTRNRQILPELFARGEVQINLGPSAGLVITPEINYREYRSGADEVSGGASITKYFAPSNDGSYLVGTLRGTVTDVSPGSNTGYEVGGSLIHVMPQYYTLGAEVFGGLMAYDSVLSVGATPVRNEFVGVRPSASAYASENVELFVRAEYIWTEAYDIVGGSAGIKIEF